MQVTIFAGKGGVGKSTAAAAYAFYCADSGPALVVDYDGGHSLARVLSMRKELTPNEIIPTREGNLNIAVLDPVSFTPISESQADGWPIQRYLAQFPEDYGLVPFCDMATSFFGVPTDINTASRFGSLVKIYHEAGEAGVKNLILDVEPTAGLERMLSASAAITRSLVNLRHPPFVARLARGPMFKLWPDIGAYVKGHFIRDVDRHSKRIGDVSAQLNGARYFVVCIPQSSPVDEMEDVEAAIQSYGGVVTGYVINDIRREKFEIAQITRVYGKADERPVIEVKHDRRLCDSNQGPRIEALKEVGRLFKPFMDYS